MQTQDNNPRSTCPYTGDPEHDQQVFDTAVNKGLKIVLPIVAGLAILGAVLMSAVALNQSGQRAVAMSPTSMPMAAARVQPAAPAVAPAAAKTISLMVGPEWKLGPDGKKHDAFSKADFTVKVGQALLLKITNKDDVPHGINSPAAGVSIAAQPGTHTYTLLVKTAGKFQWFCPLPCDSFSMSHDGYMMGYITASA